MTNQKSYYRVILGQKHKHAKECYEGEFIGVQYFIGAHYDGIKFDLSSEPYEDWADFNAKYRAMFLENHSDKTKIAAGLASGVLWNLSKGIKKGDIVLCPSGEDEYWFGEVISDYLFQEGSFFPHQRKVKWFPKIIGRDDVSPGLKSSTGSTTTIISIEKHAEEIERLISGELQPQLIATDESVEDASKFALEKHLEDFLVQNWKSTEIGKKYDIIEQQYKTDTGFIDIFAISKDKKELLVIELKKGRPNDVVVGQVLRYMGDVQEQDAESGQKIRGVIIALEDSKNFQRALKFTNNIDFYEYKVNFSLSKK